MCFMVGMPPDQQREGCQKDSSKPAILQGNLSWQELLRDEPRMASRSPHVTMLHVRQILQRNQPDLAQTAESSASSPMERLVCQWSSVFDVKLIGQLVFSAHKSFPLLLGFLLSGASMFQPCASRGKSGQSAARRPSWPRGQFMESSDAQKDQDFQEMMKAHDKQKVAFKLCRRSKRYL